MPENNVATLIDSVDKLAKTVNEKIVGLEGRVDKVVKFIDGDYKTDMNDITQRVKAIDEKGGDWHMDEENLSKMLEDIMAKQIKEQNENRVFWPDKSIWRYTIWDYLTKFAVSSSILSNGPIPAAIRWCIDSSVAIMKSRWARN